MSDTELLSVLGDVSPEFESHFAAACAAYAGYIQTRSAADRALHLAAAAKVRAHVRDVEARVLELEKMCNTLGVIGAAVGGSLAEILDSFDDEWGGEDPTEATEPMLKAARAERDEQEREYWEVWNAFCAAIGESDE